MPVCNQYVAGEIYDSHRRPKPARNFITWNVLAQKGYMVLKVLIKSRVGLFKSEVPPVFPVKPFTSFSKLSRCPTKGLYKTIGALVLRLSLDFSDAATVQSFNNPYCQIAVAVNYLGKTGVSCSCLIVYIVK